MSSGSSSIESALAAHLPLEGLSAEARRALASLTRRITLADGETLFREGDPGTFAFLVESGTLVAEQRSGDRTIELRDLGAGELGGLTSMYVDKTRSASLRARGPASVLAFPRADFVATLAKQPTLASALIAYLGHKVRDKTRVISSLMARAGRDPRERVACFDTKPYERAAFEARLPADLLINFLEPRLSLETVALARGYPVVCAFVQDTLDRAVLAELARFGTRLVALRCAGYNHVDLAAARELGIEVTRVPAYSPAAVAEHAVALMLALNRKIHRAHLRVRDGNFRLDGLVGFDMKGKRAGIVGLGNIGMAAARILRGFGMTVLGYDVSPDPGYQAREGVQRVPFDELLATSDVISLHLPLTKDTHHLFDAARLARMKHGAILINTSRGGLVDTVALIDALKAGALGAAGLDVYEEESAYFFEDRSGRAIDDDVLARLMTLPNVLVTSHQGFLTAEALDNIAESTLASIEAFLRGEPVANRVGPPS